MRRDKLISQNKQKITRRFLFQIIQCVTNEDDDATETIGEKQKTDLVYLW